MHAFVAAERPELLEAFYLISGGIFSPAIQRYVDLHGPRMLDKPLDSAVVRALIEERAPAAERMRAP